MSTDQNGRRARPYHEKRKDHQSSHVPNRNIPSVLGQGGDKQPSRLQGNPAPADKITSVHGQRGNKQHSKLPGSPAPIGKGKVTPVDGQRGDNKHARPPGNPAQTEKVSSVDDQGGNKQHAKPPDIPVTTEKVTFVEDQGGEKHHTKSETKQSDTSLDVSATAITHAEEVKILKNENQYLKTILDHFHRNIFLGETTPEQELKPPEDIQNNQSILEVYTNAQRVAHKFHELERGLDFIYRRMSQSSFMIAGGEEGEGETTLQEWSNKNTAAGRIPEKDPASTSAPSEHKLDSVSQAPKERNEKESNREDLSNRLEELIHLPQHMEGWDTNSDHQKFSESSDKSSVRKVVSESKAHPREKKFDVSQSVKEVQKMIRRQEDEINKLKSDLKEAEENSRKSQLAERTKLEEEVKSLLTRLSELAGAKFSKDNPDVSDLSDPNRPTKLAEHYSELYSNEWTDSFQQLSESESTFSEEMVTKYLLDILLEGFKYCKSIKDLQHEGLLENILFPARDKEAQLQVKAESDTMNEVSARHLTDAVKLCGETTGKHIAKVFIERKETKNILRKDTDKDTLYAQKCVQLCWLMQVQTPPVCIDLSFKPGDQFDKDTFLEYTKKGKKIDFIVWPPLRRCDGGPLLAKGVAQGK